MLLWNNLFLYFVLPYSIDVVSTLSYLVRFVLKNTPSDGGISANTEQFMGSRKCVRENFGHIENVLALAYVFMTDEVENVNQNISLCRDRNFDRQVCSKSGPIFDAINQLCQYQFQADCISKPVIGDIATYLILVEYSPCRIRSVNTHDSMV